MCFPRGDHPANRCRPTTRDWRAPGARPGHRGRGGKDALADEGVRGSSRSSIAVSGPGLCRIWSGIAILPTSCSSAARATRSSCSPLMPTALARSAAMLATPSRCSPSFGSRSRRIRIRTSRVWRSAELGLLLLFEYMRLSAIRSASEGVRASAGSLTTPYELPIWNASPFSLRAAAAAETTPSRASSHRGGASTQNSSPPSR